MIWLFTSLLGIPAFKDDAECELQEERTLQRMKELVVVGAFDRSKLETGQRECICACKASATGAFNRGKYEEAFPELFRQAKLGMKEVQARFGFICLPGQQMWRCKCQGIRVP